MIFNTDSVKADPVLVKAHTCKNMFVNSEGETFMSIEGVSTLCGIDVDTILDLLDSPTEEFARLLKDTVYEHIPIGIKAVLEKEELTIYSDQACILILEYYALEVGSNPIALDRYRKLVRRGLKSFIQSRIQ